MKFVVLDVHGLPGGPKDSTQLANEVEADSPDGAVRTLYGLAEGDVAVTESYLTGRAWHVRDINNEVVVEVVRLDS